MFLTTIWGLLGLLFVPPAANATLTPETKAGYQKYIASLESRLTVRNHSEDDYLWIDRDGHRQQSVKNGSIATEHVNSFSVPGGMIQHWIGGVFLPGATLAQIKQVDQDYADYGKMYSPEITQPKVLSHQGDHFVVTYRITKENFLIAVIDTVHAIDYVPVSSHRLTIQSRSESVRQVKDPGTPSEQVLAEGEGDGLLWAMNSYWRMQQRDGGVYVECEAITLSRSVPFGMGALIDPILRSFAEESLKRTLEAKRRAVESIR